MAGLVVQLEVLPILDLIRDEHEIDGRQRAQCRLVVGTGAVVRQIGVRYGSVLHSERDSYGLDGKCPEVRTGHQRLNQRFVVLNQWV